jgi:hypothetical protein
MPRRAARSHDHSKPKGPLAAKPQLYTIFDFRVQPVHRFASYAGRKPTTTDKFHREKFCEKYFAGGSAS